ncbi:acyl-CoA N-acyltransferase [Aspergillus steynii IBT 23096]|uniref:Acyl-CoA N-acyltransferase n=1 Tax=Aspergillus steynii IBT 23096 TaxID=1392250 RepID=A0A2I2GD94_9EURO|nr:acyl-CoA N-acyltransferase [Aspergillus steynii IBT 23096]PLB50821.1 acyl-CoA N-acyltransferase [Aspergillus steynii IBT 23096]
MPSDFLAQCPSLIGLNAFTRPLSPNDVQSCATVESAFPKHERCSEAKFTYRLSQTPELCLGLFIQPPNTAREQLIGHIIANRTRASLVTHESMLMPDSWASLPPNTAATVNGEIIGNDPQGTNIAIHSVAMVPEYQGGGVGRALVKEYIEYIRRSKESIQAERIILLAHDYLIRFYESVGFVESGPSACQFAGGGWFDLAVEI